MRYSSVIGIPPTFVVGLYGMNFDREKGNMPELGWQYGYPAMFTVKTLP